MTQSNQIAIPLPHIRHFLLDMDGTIYLGKRPLDGAVEFIHYLRETGRRFLFFTNNPASDAMRYSEKLGKLGIEAAPDEILTSGEAMTRYLTAETSHRKLFVLGTPSFEAELERAGFTLVDSAPDAVVLAFDNTLTYAKLEKACLLLHDGAPYFATNPDKLCPTEYGYIPDCGSIAALLHAATEREPKYIGKPNPEMARMGMTKIGGALEDTAMVGDRLYTDMAMAYRTGITSILVLTGETTPETLSRSTRKPDYVFDSVAGLRAAMELSDKSDGSDASDVTGK